ncbi:hypothetical protein SBRY_10332 [Actinacidiphila bryophytorum]|uniref:Uncharacterized protein n=1 Tax=Actinacidiphila bryophytorum TaxID=1436133 RepID=A0A9W4E087_9ACTN|nr:hypothetical protein SBRY_10332 [Actinacidiphila bryophytorum]
MSLRPGGLPSARPVGNVSHCVISPSVPSVKLTGARRGR